MPTFRDDQKLGTMVPLMKTDDYNDQSVTEKKLKDGNITTRKLADGSVTSDKIADSNVVTSKIANQNVTTEKLQDSGVTTDKLADLNVTTEKLNDKSVTTEKMADGSVVAGKIKNGNVTTEKLGDSSVTSEKVAEKNIVNSKLGDSSVDERTIKDKNVTNRKIADSAVGTSKLHDQSVTNEKMADNTLTLDKFDPELRKSLEAATGLPDNLLTMIQDVDENLAKLNDTVYPITLGFSLNPNVGTMQTEVKYSVSSDGKPFVPDTLEISKSVNDNLNMLILTRTPTSNGSEYTNIEGCRETFKFSVTKKGRTGKTTSQTRYLCYYGGNPAATMTAEILNALNKVSSTGVSFNPSITTKDNDYIWLVVPSYLSISRVTSAGFEVPLSAPQVITNNLGSFKAYRTINSLTANTWNLVIS